MDSSIGQVASPREQCIHRYCVVMTACVDPSKGWVKIHRADPSVRLLDYVEGLRFWLGLEDPRLDAIVFIENSGHPLGPLRELAARWNPFRKKVEFISIDGNDYPAGVHYGYAELGMVDHALSASELLRRSSHFIKASGRLSFPEILKLLDRLPDDCLFAVDSRNSARLRRLPQVFVSTQLMVFSTPFYREHFLGIQAELGSRETLIENLFYRKLMPFAGQPGTMLRWPVNVAPVGVAAHWDKRYDSPKQKVTNFARALCRIAFPNWWI